MHSVDYPIKLNLLEYLIKHVIFTLQPKWLHSVYEYLLEGVMLKRFSISQKQYLAQRTKPFVLKKGALYIFGQDN
jgi:hypothetical protein